MFHQFIILLQNPEFYILMEEIILTKQHAQFKSLRI